MDKGKKIKKGIFITATDTGIGKTVATAVLGVLLQNKGYNIGVMKPVQCGGNDAVFLKSFLKIADPLEEINPFYAPEPLSPHLAFKRARKKIDIQKIISIYQELQSKHDVVLVEGAGGLMVPLRDDYQIADLIRDLNLDTIIVSRLGLGTINHTLLTVGQIKLKGVRVRGIVFSKTNNKKKSIPEETNSTEIGQLTNLPILGIIPYLKTKTQKEVLKRCNLDLGVLFESSKEQPPTPPMCRTVFTEELRAWDKKYLWHPFTQMKDWLESEPLVIDRADGCYLIDTDGRRYLDGVSSLWVNVHGHRKKEMDQTIKAQIDKLSHSTLLGLANTPSIELAKKLIEIAPKEGNPSTTLRTSPLARVFYSDNGSTAVEVAIKMAYQYWQNLCRSARIQFVHLANSYHGDTLGSVSVGGVDLFHKVYKDLTFKTISFDSLQNLKKLEELFKASEGTIAAFIIEPLIQGAAGMLLWPKGALRKVRELCTKYDIFLIADEVATGFGRTGKMFACEHEGITPDILCLAKGLTGGYLPLAATLTTKRIFDGFLFDYKDQKTFFHGHTYTGNPLACAAALANLEIFEKERTLEKLAPKIKFLAENLKMFYNYPHVGEIRQLGFMVGIELVKDRTTKEPFAWEDRIGVKVCTKARERGVILRPLSNVIVLMPPLGISTEELKYLLDVTYWAITQVTRYQWPVARKELKLAAGCGTQVTK